MDDNRISLEFGDSVNLDRELGYEVPDLHQDVNDYTAFEVDVRFEFDAPQYYDFMEEMMQNVDMKLLAEDPSNDDWFSEHHVRHEAQKTLECTASVKRRCRNIAQPDESSSIEKLLAEHNRKIREENMLKVKSRRGDSEAASKSPIKRSLISKPEANVRNPSPQRPKLLRKTVIVSSSLPKSPRPTKLLRKSVIVPSSELESPSRNRKLTELPKSNSISGRKRVRQSTIFASSGPASPQRSRLLRKSVIVTESEIKLRARDPNIDVALKDNRVCKPPTYNAPIKTRVEINVCAPACKSSITNAAKDTPVVKKPRSGKENMDDIAEMLANHNQKFKSRPSYVPRQHSTRDVRQWERLTGKLWYELGPEDREIANHEIAEMKNAQKSNIKQPAHQGVGYISCPR